MASNPSTNEDPAGPSPLADIRTLDERLRSVPSTYVAGLIATLYIFGFIISNAHQADYGFLNYELIEGRHLGAGILFMFFSAAPVTAGIVFGGRLWQMKDKSANKGSLISSAWRVLGALLLAPLAFGFNLFALGFIGVSDSYPPSFRLFIYCTLCFLLPLLVTYYHFEKDGPIPRIGTIHPATLMFGGMGACILPIAFAVSVYPEISPVFAGGAGWLAEVQLSDADRKTTLGTAHSDTVLVMGVSDGFLSLVVCPGRDSTHLPERILLPAEKVLSLRMVGHTTISAYTKNERAANCLSTSGTAPQPQVNERSPRHPARAPNSQSDTLKNSSPLRHDSTDKKPPESTKPVVSDSAQRTPN